jgi:hypothetical protein
VVDLPNGQAVGRDIKGIYEENLDDFLGTMFDNLKV